MKKIVVIFNFILSTTVQIFAQAPDWKVNESSYQYTMTIQAKLNVDGVTLANQNDMVGAFVGNTCRGVAKLTYVATTKSYYAYLTVFSNTANEVITFSIFNSTNNKITKVAKSINFNASQHTGNLFQSYSIAEPALSDKAEMLTFDFLNIKTLSNSISPGNVKINIPKSAILNNLTPVFTLSKGANLFKDRIIQPTRSSAADFTAPVIYEVLSEDESKINTYSINVTQIIEPPKFYKKDAVCSKLGAIKIVSNNEGVQAQISNNGKLVSNRAISNGEAIFENLLSGTYVVTIGNENKTIIINQKTN